MITKFFEKIPWTFLLPVSILMALTPFKPQPHLIEKLHLLSEGLLTRPIDIFDLFMHGTPLLVVLGKLLLARKSSSETSQKKNH